MLKEKIRIEKVKAVRITADFTAPAIGGYAMAWLKLCNNARECKNVIYRISNGDGNNVEVVCRPEKAEEVKEFLTGIVSYYDGEKVTYIGRVIATEETLIGKPIYEFDSDADSDEEWDKDFDNVIGLWMDVREE